GNYDIVCYYSYDYGFHWGTLTVTDFDGNERFPRIHGNGTHLICSFEKSNNLYITKSVDYGSTWSDPEQINVIDGSVCPFYKFSSFGDDYGIVWMDEREEFPTIYFSALAQSYQMGDVDLEIIPDSASFNNLNNSIVWKVKNILSFEIENKGNCTVYDVDVVVYIRYRGSNDLYCVAESNIPLMAPSDKEILSIEIFSPTIRDVAKSLVQFANIDEIVIKIDPYNRIMERREDNNELIMDVNYGDIFPRLSWVENIVLRWVGEMGLDNSILEDTLTQILSRDINQDVLQSLIS
ncbi:MAG TPA: hypothetical protein ENF43_04185, partial [Thermoplasmatales archaeon]|nr:hypothetical protein [Thermoplasmatales archaeon]